MEEQQYLSVADVARLLGVSQASVYQWVRQDKLKALRVGKLLRFTQEAVDEFMGNGHPAPVRPLSLGEELAAIVRRIIREELAS